MAEPDGWSIDRAMAEMTVAGVFGPGLRYVSFERDHYFASTLLFGTLTVTAGDDSDDAGGEGHRRQRQLAIKFKHRVPEMRAMCNNDLQFHNEILFFERIAPFLMACARSTRDHECKHNRSRVTPLLPRYFYGRNDCGDRASQDMVVLESVCLHEYRLSDQLVYLDFDHLAVALRTLAKFHGLSYRAKHDDPVKFAETIAGVKETQWDADGQWYVRGDGLGKLLETALDRLAERHGDGMAARRFRTELLGDARRTLRHVMEPVEPSAVLCHGDFNWNNLLFRYDSGGRPVDVMLVEMSNVRYGSPALDLSFFLYMNTDRRLRDARWDELLDAYCAALSSAVSDSAGAVWVPDRARLDEEMREHSFYGLAHVSFSVRLMAEEHRQVDPAEFINVDDDEALCLLLAFGGDRATDTLADAVQHFLDISYNRTMSSLE
ncbi:Protein of unknown function DUF227,Protein kinase-like domain,CHK kinase-like [Cinara cedri]|uniref:CHK kinase-like domain-containing protein n=1 Tax=Cinara cedri TaxID=506608 RepID=A0A5E4NEA9_9HEMI|nr:Protein of unknown function DUF227,Protein kinase-like domain,CHK kinase-like [Cinara cedri]